jgi:hypothetical protein
MTSANTTLPTPLPRMASIINATRMAGKDSWMSTMRISSASIQPPVGGGQAHHVPMASASGHRCRPPSG